MKSNETPPRAHTAKNGVEGGNLTDHKADGGGGKKGKVSNFLANGLNFKPFEIQTI